MIVVPLRFVFAICPDDGSSPVSFVVLETVFAKHTWTELPYGACTGYTVAVPTVRLFGGVDSVRATPGVGVHESYVVTV